MKSGCDWLILGSTMTVDFLPCKLHWMGLATLTWSLRFSLHQRQRGEKSERFIARHRRRIIVDA